MERESLPRPGAVACGVRQMLVADAGALAALGVLAVALGLLGNTLRRDPVPLRYVSAPARLQAALASLSTSGSVSRPVAEIGLEAFKKLAADRAALILDARADLFYHAGHVPGAYNLARESFGADYARLRPRLEAAKESQKIVVYCSDVDCPDSGLVASALEQLGFRQVVDFPAGWEGWTAAGLPEEKQTLP